MAISYNGLWKLLIDKNLKKTEFMEQVGISSGTLAKMGRNEEVSISILTKICEKYDCDYGDLISYDKDAVVKEPNSKK
ncbi:MAG: helix-turn-helix transcriptional regulator [Oribacterium sp.]|nr:helix-turn-helix transcriptional regulator [Oribacterium sp.]MBO6309564.1 helix-turn-helix transcriptional regulator [Oribacterium sp.]MBP5607528.1 helix-turn-helix transcriptional regulator [Lachnospiraceae bacterium]